MTRKDVEDHCSEENVYIAFQFTGPARNAIGWTADASDKLRAVTIFRWLEGASDEPHLDAVVIKKRHSPLFLFARHEQPNRNQLFAPPNTWPVYLTIQMA